jgi:hypothetical protein
MDSHDAFVTIKQAIMSLQVCASAGVCFADISMSQITGGLTNILYKATIHKVWRSFDVPYSKFLGLWNQVCAGTDIWGVRRSP